MAVSPLPTAKDAYARATTRYPTHMRTIRFIISGGTATAANLGILFILTHFFSLWYLLSSIIAFLAAFFVSFTMQKLWTFENTSTNRAHVQAFTYLIVMLVGLGVNTALIYAFVEYAHLHYLLAQFISGIFIAYMNYFSYKHLVFHDNGKRRQNSPPSVQ